ncbi:MAG: murein biosynthesis integral membrane protein MurJ [Candidatus Brocadiaceae bacterium]|nr:murein biosynthesis integral membrane protein MurJ [Candidatus Brocadiaceae bacterium]
MTPEGLSSPVSMKKERLASAAFLVLFFSCLSAVLSYLKMYITTSTFGATGHYDAFLVALTLPDVICNIVVSALGVVFIPLFSECANKEGTEKAWDFLNSLLNWAFLCTFLLSTLLVLLSPWIVKIIAPGLDEGGQRLSVQLMVIMVPIIMTMALARLMMGFLQIHHNFSIPALGGVVNLLVIISCIYFLSKKWGIYSLAIGMALGALGWLLLHLPYTIKEIKKSYSLNLALHPFTKKFALLMVPIVVGASISQLGVVVERALASHLTEGSISYLGYANSLMRLPSDVFMGVIGTVLFPTLSQQATRENWQEFRRSFSAGVRMGNLVLVPSAMLLLFFGNLIIQILFERGQFLPSMTEGTARALAFYSIGLLVLAPFNMAQYSYFALQRYWPAVRVVICCASAGILLRFLLVKPLAYMGLALAASLTLILYVIVMVWCLRDVLEGPEMWEILTSFLKVLFSSVAAAYGAAFMGSYLNHAQSFIQLSAILLTGMALYTLFIYFLEVQEFYSLLELVRKFIRNRTAVET